VYTCYEEKIHLKYIVHDYETRNDLVAQLDFVQSVKLTYQSVVNILSHVRVVVLRVIACELPNMWMNR
jgi:hypothetical protein